jgi:hypothetical protein
MSLLNSITIMDGKVEKLVIVKIHGGLGNQMFQYAFYSKLIALGYNAKLDISYYERFRSFNGFELPKVFNKLDFKFSTEDELARLSNLKQNFFIRLKRKFIPKKTHYIERIYSFDYNYHLIISLLLDSNLYLDGYWQDHRYFNDLRDKIVRGYSFSKLNNCNLELLKNVDGSACVGMHIRRGDKIDIEGNIILGLDYYKEAIHKIKERIGEQKIKLLVFSDDIEWARENLSNLKENISYVDHNKGEDSFRDMQLMSMCHHNIIGASTFSWWSAYLNQNKNKIVIASSRMFSEDYAHLENDYFTPPDWIKI